MNLDTILEKAVAIAHATGELIRAQAAQPRLANRKSAQIDLVTETDQQAEALIVKHLTQYFPDHHIVGEEGGSYENGGKTTYRWYIDPIDGTTNFAHGIPHYSVSLAMTGPDGLPLVGVVYDPMRDEMFAATQGGGATLNNRPIHVSVTPRLAEAVVATGFPYDKWTDPANNAAEWSNFLVRTSGVRRQGSAALDLAYVATGRYDGYWEQKLNPWDALAGVLLVIEAGGTVTDYDGKQNGITARYPRIVATNGYIHAEMLAVLQQGEMAPRP